MLVQSPVWSTCGCLGEGAASRLPGTSALPVLAEPPGAVGPAALPAGCSCLLIPSPLVLNGRGGGIGCPWGAGRGDRSVPRVQAWRRAGAQLWAGTGAAVGVQAWGWAPHSGANSSTGVRELRCCPAAMLTAAPGPKVPSCVTAVLPQASCGCLLCCFEDGSAPTQLVEFFPPAEPQHVMEVDRVLGSTGGTGTKPPAALCSLTHHAMPTDVPASHGHQSCHLPTAQGARAVGEPVPLLGPSSSRARPQASGHRQSRLASRPLQRQRLLCCPCRVGWRSVTFERWGPAF